MKKEEMIQELIDNGYQDVNELNWNELRKLFKEFQNPAMTIKPVTQEFVEEKLERKLSYADKQKLELVKVRKELIPMIRQFIKKMKGRHDITKAEEIEMFDMYNKYYKRTDKPGCSSCSARVYNTLKKLI